MSARAVKAPFILRAIHVFAIILAFVGFCNLLYIHNEAAALVQTSVGMTVAFVTHRINALIVRKKMNTRPIDDVPVDSIRRP